MDDLLPLADGWAKVFAIVIGAVVSALVVILNWRKETRNFEAQREAAAKSAPAIGVMAVGSMLADREDARALHETWKRIAFALERVVEADKERSEDGDRRHKLNRDALEEMIRLRQAAEGINHWLRQGRGNDR